MTNVGCLRPLLCTLFRLNWASGKVRMYLDEIDRYRKIHVYDVSKLSHKLDEHTKPYCLMNGISGDVRVSTKGGKYYPLIYPESVGLRKCGHAFFEYMGYLSHKKTQEINTGCCHMEG